MFAPKVANPQPQAPTQATPGPWMQSAAPVRRVGSPPTRAGLAPPIVPWGGPLFVQRACTECDEEKERATLPISLKLIVGSSSDPLEREADQVAEKLVSPASPGLAEAAAGRGPEASSEHERGGLWQELQSSFRREERRGDSGDAAANGWLEQGRERHGRNLCSTPRAEALLSRGRQAALRLCSVPRRCREDARASGRNVEEQEAQHQEPGRRWHSGPDGWGSAHHSRREWENRELWIPGYIPLMPYGFGRDCVDCSAMLRLHTAKYAQRGRGTWLPIRARIATSAAS